MTPGILATIEAVLLSAGALAAYRFSRWLSRDASGGVPLMAAVTMWFICFGLIPFFVFALLVKSAADAATRPAMLSSFVLNMTPFALVAAPLIGFAHGMKLRRR